MRARRRDELDTLARREHDLAAGRGDHAVVLDRRRDEIDRPARVGVDRARVHHLAGVAGVGETELAGEEILVRHVQARSDEAGGVDQRARADRHAVGIDQEHATIREQLSEQGRVLGPGDAVEHRARRARLHEARDFVGADREALPVDDRAGRVRDRQVLADGAEACRAAHDRRPDGVGIRGGGEAGRHRDRDQPAPESSCRHRFVRRSPQQGTARQRKLLPLQRLITPIVGGGAP